MYKNINMRRSKSWDMRFHWLRDREAPKQFEIYWKPGPDNHGDYWSEHHPTIVHRKRRGQYIHDKRRLVICIARVC